MAGNKLFAGLPDDLPEEKKQDTGTPLPAELQGKDPGEVYEMLRQENERLLQEQEQRLKAQNYDQIQQGQKTAQSQGQGQQSYQPPPPQFGGYGGQQQGQQNEPDMYSDPEGFMDRQLERRLGPVMQSTLNSLKESNKQSFKQQIGTEEWSKYGSEIEQFVNSLSPQAQMTPQAFSTAYNYVRSMHLDEISESKAEKLAEQKVRERLEAMGLDPDAAQDTTGSVDQRVQQAVQQQQGSQQQQQPTSSLFQRDTGTVPQNYGRSSSAAQGQNRKARLSDNEKRLAEQFDMTEEEYLEYKKFNTDIYAGMEAN